MSSSSWCLTRSPLRQGRASLVTSVNTHPRGGFLSHQGTRTTWAMAFPRTNCRTTTATVLTATATVYIVTSCVFVLPFVPPPVTSPSAADSFNFLKQLGTGKPCIISQEISHKCTLSRQTAEDRQERRCTHRRPVSRVEPGQRGPPWWRGQCVCSCVTLPSQDQPRRGAGRSRRTSSPSGSSARRAGLEQARIVISQESHIEVVVFLNSLVNSRSTAVEASGV